MSGYVKKLYICLLPPRVDVQRICKIITLGDITKGVSGDSPRR